MRPNASESRNDRISPPSKPSLSQTYLTPAASSALKWKPFSATRESRKRLGDLGLFVIPGIWNNTKSRVPICTGKGYDLRILKAIKVFFDSRNKLEII